MGWGDRIERGLRTASLTPYYERRRPILNHEGCRAVFGDLVKPNQTICMSGGRGGRGGSVTLCRGDSGGPMTLTVGAGSPFDGASADFP